MLMLVEIQIMWCIQRDYKYRYKGNFNDLIKS